MLLPSCAALADDSERAFLLCDGVSQKDSAQSFAFTVTLDIPNGKVLNIGSGNGAVTETFTDSKIVGKHDLGLPPGSGGMGSEDHAALRVVTPSMLARTSAGVR